MMLCGELKPGTKIAINTMTIARIVSLMNSICRLAAGYAETQQNGP